MFHIGLIGLLYRGLQVLYIRVDNRYIYIYIAILGFINVVCDILRHGSRSS